jgi:hypothetical protein
MEGRCLVSQAAMLHVAGWKWAVFTRVYVASCTWPIAIFTMDKRKEQWVCINVCVSLGKRATETLTMIQQTLGDKPWVVHRCFKSMAGSEPVVYQLTMTNTQGDTEAAQHTGRPTSCTTTETVARIQELVRQDRRRTIHNISEEMAIGYGYRLV